MGLAVEERRGTCRHDNDPRSTFSRMGERNDIIRTMQCAMTVDAPERPPTEYAIYDVGSERTAAITGWELDKPFVETRPGQQIDRLCRCAVQVVDAKFGRSKGLGIP